MDRDATNNAISNLAFLCLLHHDDYDSKASQSKGLTADELSHYRELLETHWANAVRGKRPRRGAGSTLRRKSAAAPRPSFDLFDAFGYPTFLGVADLPQGERHYLEDRSPKALDRALTQVAQHGREAVGDNLYRGCWVRWAGKVDSIQMGDDCVSVFGTADEGGTIFLTFPLSARPLLATLRKGEWIRISGQIRTSKYWELVKVEIEERKAG